MPSKREHLLAKASRLERQALHWEALNQPHYFKLAATLKKRAEKIRQQAEALK